MAGCAPSGPLDRPVVRGPRQPDGPGAAHGRRSPQWSSFWVRLLRSSWSVRGAWCFTVVLVGSTVV